jgi:L-lactate dehydrogenase (cytochrome)
MAAPTSVRDLRELARRRLPRALFEYADRGAFDEFTLTRNRRDFDVLTFRQRVLLDVSRMVLSTSILGQRAAIPVGIGPTGLAGFMRPRGEILSARAAEAFGVPYCLSTMSVCSLEEVRAAVKQPFWFQLYVMRDRGLTRSLIERAAQSGCSALMLTVDLPIQGHRHADAKNGLQIPPRLTLANFLDMLRRPAWLCRFLNSGARTFGNLAGHVPGADNLGTLSQWIASQFDPSLTWQDVEWIRGLWPNKLIVKGIMDPQDARLAVDAGADAIVVSNHGGRQLDGAPSTISVLPAIVAAIDGRREVLIDGGVLTGQDILKALALGARACLAGKAFLYGLGAMGEAGVSAALGMMERELRVSAALTGVTDINSVDRTLLAAPAGAR